MSETLKFWTIGKKLSKQDIDLYLSALVEAGIDCYAEGDQVRVHPDQWNEAVDSLQQGERRSAQVNV